VVRENWQSTVIRKDVYALPCLNEQNCDDYEKNINGAHKKATFDHEIYLPVLLKNHHPPSTGTWEIILNEDFEGNFPGNWVVFDEEINPSENYWEKRTCRVYTGNHSGWAVGGGADGASLACNSDYPTRVTAWMIYGPFSLADATAAELRFKAWVNTEPQFDFLCGFASLDGTSFAGDCIWGNSSGWIDQVLDLSNVTNLGNVLGEANVWIGLHFHSDSSKIFSEGAYVDDIILRKCTSGNCSSTAVSSSPSDTSDLITFPTMKSIAPP
jgi:hypothetical protein